MPDRPLENRGVAEASERYVGRWSRPVVRAVLAGLEVPGGGAWADIGCAPGSVTGFNRARGFVEAARRQITDARASFKVADAARLPLASGSGDAAVSGLMLNFVADPAAMLREMVRITRPGGVVAAYVWDHAGGMTMMHHFWDVAATVRPETAGLDEAERFPLCRPEPLAVLWSQAGLLDVSVSEVATSNVFRDFWTPFLGGQGAAPTYLASLAGEAQEEIRAALQAHLRPVPDGSIVLTARAWAVQGRR